ncbi:MAG TPA: MFS transporter [Thermoanaerobaculia bacterium]
MSRPDEPPVAPERLLNRSFVLLWQGQLVSQLGNQAFLVAAAFWTLEATGSASLLGLLMMCSAVPMVVLGPLAGAFADRHSRVAIVVGADLVRGLAVLSLAGLLVVRPSPPELAIAWLLAVALVEGVVGAVFRPAVAALVPDLVPRERVAAANSLTQTSAQAAVMVGQAIGGLAYRWLGAAVLFAVDGTTYLLSALSEAFIRPRGEPPRREVRLRDAFGAYRRDAGEGFRYVWRRHGMRGFLGVAAAFNLFAMPVFVLLPFYVTERLAAGAAWYGFLLAAMGGGSLVGYLAGGAAKLAGTARAGVILGLFATAGTAVALLGAVRLPVIALVLFALLGAASGAINLFVLTLFQLAAPADMRGRVLGLVVALSAAAAPVGMALGGVAGDLVTGVHRLYAACGAALLVVAAAAARSAAVRGFLAGAGE